MNSRSLRSLIPAPALRRASRRYLSRHGWQTWLSVIGIALGVAVVIAVDLANHSASRGFQLSVSQVTGPATHQIEAATGEIANSVYADLRLHHHLPLATPVIDAPVRIGGRGFTLLGVDLIAATAMRGPFARSPTGKSAANATGGNPVQLLTGPNSLALSASDAAELGFKPGDEISVGIDGRPHRMTLATVFADGGGPSDRGLALTDIATAQEVLERLTGIERVDLILTDTEATALADKLPQGLRLLPIASRTNALEQMTRAFRTNLTAMSLLALLVGGFIVYNTMTFAVLQRRQFLGSLRMLGVTRSQMFVLVLTESLGLALIGSVIGVIAGILVGSGLVQLVTRTINDLYFQLNVRDLHLDPWSLGKGVLLGLGVTLLAALGPALEAARSQPRDVLRRNLIERRGRRALPGLALLGLAFMLAGGALIGLSDRSMALGFAALFLVIIGFSLLIPLTLLWLTKTTTPAFGRFLGSAGRLAARGITASISRTGLAVAALTVAVAASVGVAIMIGSFRASVSDWLEDTLSSDIYISTDQSSSATRRFSLPPELGKQLARLPGVAAVSAGRRNRVQTREGPTNLLALSGGSNVRRGFDFKGATEDNLWQRWQKGELVLISEPLAHHRSIAPGERLELLTHSGWRGFRVGGIFRDYGSDSGMLVLPLSIYAALWADEGVSSHGVLLSEGADAKAIESDIEKLLERLAPGARLQTNLAIRQLSLDVFDRTFTITEVLRLLALGVAFIGILSALMALELERAKDHAVLRATGMTRAQLGRMILLQTSALGIAAGLLAVPLGAIMGVLLIEVINLRSFGWTMTTQLSPMTLASGILWAWSAAVLAGLYPALRAARSTPARALREE